MTTWRAFPRCVGVLAFWIAIGPASAAFAEPPRAARPEPRAANKNAQDPLARAKALYASAEFEEALGLLESLKDIAANPEAASYQVYCLVALGRPDEARKVVERIVIADPFFHPAEGQVAPRMRTFFEDSRTPLLPEAARQSFAKAKAAFDKKDMTTAGGDFNRAIVLIDEIRGAGSDMADLRVLAVGFRDLARASAQPVIYDAQHTNVRAPIPLSKPLPEWRPSLFELNQTFSGAIAVVVGEEGQVLSASIVTSVHPRYDSPLLEAAKGWKFTPAIKSGVPVTYRYVLPIQILK